jgi:hypothetical protein
MNDNKNRLWDQTLLVDSQEHDLPVPKYPKVTVREVVAP